MLKIDELKGIAAARVEDAAVLLAGGRFDGAAYMVGYAVEMALKARICRTLGWKGYPATNREFADLLSFKTHKLDVLLKLSGIAETVSKSYIEEWTELVRWKPESRYNPVGETTQQSAAAMIKAAKVLVEII